MRRAVVVVAVFVLALVGAVVIVALKNPTAPMPLPIPLGKACEVRTANGSVELNADQMANAATIAAVGMVRGLPEQAIVVALATAFQESRLYNLDYGDRDSLGLFQQRPSQGWGTPEQILDPRYAAGRLYSALVRVRGWEEMRVTDAAQRVQRSAFPEAYQKWADEATVLAEAFVGRASGAVTCTRNGEPVQRGSTALEALDAALRLDWGDFVDVRESDGMGLVLAAANPQDGWRYAHWIVAHSVEKGVERVRYLDREWTGDGAGWRLVDTTLEHVVAEVFQE